MSKRLRVRTPQGMGFIFDGTSLRDQLARNRIGVVLDTWHGPMRYFDPDEVEVFSSTRYLLRFVTQHQETKENATHGNL